jgi:hypothetical protein
MFGKLNERRRGVAIVTSGCGGHRRCEDRSRPDRNAPRDEQPGYERADRVPEHRHTRPDHIERPLRRQGRWPTRPAREPGIASRPAQLRPHSVAHHRATRERRRALRVGHQPPRSTSARSSASSRGAQRTARPPARCSQQLRSRSKTEDRAGQGPRDALHRLHLRDDHPAELVDVLRLRPRDDVVRSRNDVGRHDPLELGDRARDRRRLPDLRLDEDEVVPDRARQARNFACGVPSAWPSATSRRSGYDSGTSRFADSAWDMIGRACGSKTGNGGVTDALYLEDDRPDVWAAIRVRGDRGCRRVHGTVVRRGGTSA